MEQGLTFGVLLCRLMAPHCQQLMLLFSGRMGKERFQKYHLNMNMQLPLISFSLWKMKRMLGEFIHRLYTLQQQLPAAFSCRCYSYFCEISIQITKELDTKIVLLLENNGASYQASIEYDWKNKHSHIVPIMVNDPVLAGKVSESAWRT